ncbi:MAG TPA: SPOR domain-containing protein [bacterium]|nr:SPOR domain-containing protein [bacterium]
MIAHVLAATFVSVQVGSYSEEGRAQHVVEELRAKGFDPYFLEYDTPEKGAHVFKVRLGSFADPAAARAAADKVKGIGSDYKGAFVTPTDLVETQTLTADILALVKDQFPNKADPGKILDHGDGHRLYGWVQNYLTLYLLAAGSPPGKRVTDLALWDTNEGNEPEVFAVIDGARAYALFWSAAGSRFEVAELADGANLSIGDALDLAPGPEKFICVRYEQGGDFYSEKGFRVFRWDQPSKGFLEVGRVPLEVMDSGDVPGATRRHKRVIKDRRSLDGGRERQLILEDAIDDSGKTHVDVWRWANGRFARVADTEWFERIFKDDANSADAAAGELGVGIEKALAGDLAGAESTFRLLTTSHPEFEEARRAEHALSQVAAQRERAKVLAASGADLARAGAPELAVEDLGAAVTDDPGNAQAWYDLCAARAAMGDDLDALVALKRALDLDADGSLKLRDKAKDDTALSRLRELPEFKEILES